MILLLAFRMCSQEGQQLCCCCADCLGNLCAQTSATHQDDGEQALPDGAAVSASSPAAASQTRSADEVMTAAKARINTQEAKETPSKKVMKEWQAAIVKDPPGAGVVVCKQALPALFCGGASSYDCEAKGNLLL